MPPSDQYTVRRFRADDRDEVISLLEGTVLPDVRDVRESWFDWRFARNPYVDSVPLTVAVDEGAVVGVRSSLPVPLCVDGCRVPALYQAEGAVHRDHRRRGLFTRMVAHDDDFYADREPVLSYGTPVPATRKALAKHNRERAPGPIVFGEVPKYYRVQELAALVDVLERPIARVGARATCRLFRWAMAALDNVGSPPTGATVDVLPGAPLETLVELGARCPTPGRVHALRDERFYRWRFGSPRFEYRTYTARLDGRAVAGAIVERPRAPRPDVARIAEVLPLEVDGEGPDLRPWLLARVADGERPGALSFVGSCLPTRALVRRGFCPRDVPPLSWATRPVGFVARPLPGDGPDGGDDQWTRNGVRLSDLSNWSLSAADVNLA